MGRTMLSAIVASICLVPHLSEAQGTPGSATPRATPGAPRGGSFGATIRPNPPQPPSRPALPPGVPIVPPAPLPPGVPLVPPAPPSALDSVDVFRAGPRTYVPGRQRFLGGYSGSGYITDPFGYISQPYAPADDSDPREICGHWLSAPRGRARNGAGLRGWSLRRRRERLPPRAARIRCGTASRRDQS